MVRGEALTARRLLLPPLAAALLLLAVARAQDGGLGFEALVPEGARAEVLMRTGDLRLPPGAAPLRLLVDPAGRAHLLAGATLVAIDSSIAAHVPELAGATSLAWAPDGALLAVVDERLLQVTPDGAELVARLPAPGLQVAPAGRDALYLFGGEGAWSGRVVLLRRSGERTTLLEADEAVGAVAGDGQRTWVALGGAVYRHEVGRPLVAVLRAQAPVRSLAARADGLVLFATDAEAGLLPPGGAGLVFLRGPRPAVAIVGDEALVLVPTAGLLRVGPLARFGAAPRGEGAGLAVSEALDGLEGALTLVATPLADRRPRLLAEPGALPALLELIGPAHDLERVTLVVWLPAADERLETLHLGRAALLRLVANTVPGARAAPRRWAERLDHLRVTGGEASEDVQGVRVQLGYDPGSETARLVVELRPQGAFGGLPDATLAVAALATLAVALLLAALGSLLPMVLVRALGRRLPGKVVALCAGGGGLAGLWGAARSGWACLGWLRENVPVLPAASLPTDEELLWLTGELALWLLAVRLALGLATSRDGPRRDVDRR